MKFVNKESGKAQQLKTVNMSSQPFHQSKNKQSREHSAGTDNQNFTVAVRMKPREISEQCIKIIINKNAKELYMETGKNIKNISYGSKCKTFKMDSVLEDTTTNTHIFDTLIKQRLNLLKKNCNVSVMAYGATNSGKTFTVFGAANRFQEETNPKNARGLAQISGRYLMEDLFKDRFRFYFSYLQIYNQNIQDLLGDSSKKHNLSLFQDMRGKINIPDLTKIEVQNYQHLCDLIEKGNKVRVQSSNNVNQMSSRSHAILQLDIFSKQDNQVISEIPIQANFMVIDLAGSEKSTPYFQEGSQVTLKEGANINRSLLALGNCIKNLASGEVHIPYRDSKLTRILKQNLSGYCHNILIACISQNYTQFQESINTLQYASKACKIERIIGGKDCINRNKNLSVPCEHCKMSLDYNYISKCLKQYSYKIVDEMLEKKTFTEEQRKEEQIPFVGTESVSNNVFNQTKSEIIDNCIRKLVALKKKQEISAELVLLQQYIDQIGHTSQINAQRQLPVDPLFAEKSLGRTASGTRIKLKKRKVQKSSEKNALQRPSKDIRNIKIDINTRQSKKQFFDELLQAKINGLACNLYENSEGSNINLVGCRDHLKENIDSNYNISLRPFIPLPNLEIVKNGNQERNEFLDQEIDKNFRNLKSNRIKKNNMLKDYSFVLFNNDSSDPLFNEEGHIEEGAKTARDTVPKMFQQKDQQKDILILPLEGKVTRRMKPDTFKQSAEHPNIGVSRIQITNLSTDLGTEAEIANREKSAKLIIKLNQNKNLRRLIPKLR